MSLFEIAKIVTGSAGTHSMNVTNKFMEALIEYKFNGISVLWYSLVFILVLVIMICLITNSPQKKSLIITGISMMISLMLYLLLLLITYIFLMSPTEGENLASLGRYICTFLLGLLLFTISCIIYTIYLESNKTSQVLLTLGLSVICLILLIRSPFSQINLQGNNENGYWYLTQKYVKRLEPYIAPASRSEIIWQNDTGLYFDMLKNLLAPQTTVVTDPTWKNGFCWSLGSPYSDADEWTCDISKDDYLNHLLKYQIDYILVAHADNKFWDKYQDIFIGEIIDNTAHLYQLNARGYYEIIR